MTGSRLMHWILCCLTAAIAFAGCTSDGTSSDTSGSLNLNLELADGIVINEVAWTISSPGMEDMTGTIDTSAPGATASVEVFGLPPGDDYLVELEATDETGTITCRGDAPFEVEVGVATDVMVFLNCKRPARLGGVRVNGKFNICAELAKVIVSPLQTSVGYDIDLSAIGQDAEGDALTYVWSATGGSIADSSAQDTTYTCEEAGQQEITILVTDNDVYCDMATWTVPVTCVGGEDLCEGVTCDDTGNECTVAECNPANGECETSAVDDGTECNEGAGMCMDGTCIDEDLCDGVDCDDDNECTADLCNPEDGSCSNTPVDDGTSCNEGAGMCMNGTCVDSDLCEGVTCDDTGNDCTVAMCNTENGECETMNVPNGTECNGGAGACSDGVCVDDNLCDGVDCSSANDCVLDGTCDPGTGECIPGDNEPADAPCAGGVCDGSGTCVECNVAGQCPDDGNACTAAACEGNACTQNAVMDGTACDFMGGDGICEAGTCVEAPACISPGDCDDGNVCTIDDCVDGECSFAPNDGASCEVSAGVPGTCAAGDCVGLCDGVDCTSASECVQDGSCDEQSGQCIPGANEPIDTACTEGGGSFCDGAGACVECNNDDQCAGSDVCNNNSCEAGAIDPPAQEAIITLGCTNNVTADISILPFALNVDPTAISGGSEFGAALDGVAEFSEVFLDAAQGAVPGGVTRANLVDLQATVQVRSGAVGGDVTLGPEPLPYICALAPTPCDPANDVASVPGNRGNTDCVPTGFFNACGRFVTVPTTTDEAECTALGKSGQWTSNGFCVTGGLPLPLDAANGTYLAEASGSVLFGWDDASSGATLNGDGTWALPPAVFTAAAGPNSIRVNASGLSVALECTMGVDSGDPTNGVGVPDQSSPTPDSLLISFDIQ